MQVVRPDQGVLGPVRILAGSNETRGLYFAIEGETPPAPASAAFETHCHEEYEESEYVVTGEHEIVVDDQHWQGGSGLFVLVPRRALHAMRTVGPTPSVWVHLFSPAGMQRFFVEREHLRAAGASEDELRELRARYGTRTVPCSPATQPVFASRAGARGGGVVVTGEQTRNAYALAERSVLLEDAHVHADQEEALYVIAGELVVEAEGVTAAVPPRSFVLVPRGVRHRHVAAAGTRLLAVFSPGHAVPH
jgi:quercetin dioxygenase-like cupin family protein